MPSLPNDRYSGDGREGNDPLRPDTGTIPADLAREMKRCGYTAGAPIWVGPHTQTIDTLCAEEYQCGECGCTCHYQPFHLLRPRRYVAYAVCPECGWWE